MIIDLHNHTTKYSKCSRISPDELVAIYIKNKIDALCITEHHIQWEKQEQEALREKYKGKIKIFFGVEVSTREVGDVLVYGTKKNSFPINISLHKLIADIKDENTALVWAHPFRWNGNRDITINKKFLSQFDAIELLNGNLSQKEIEFTKKRLARFDLVFTGGSDTHSQKMACNYATKFTNNIETIDDLVNEIKQGSIIPVKL